MTDSNILSWDAVFGPQPHATHRDLAVEVLVRPVVLRRREGRVVVQIDRQGIQRAIVSHAGRLELAKETLDRIGRARLDDKELQLQEFLASDDDGEFLIETRDFPLRWSSGGALSLVRQHGKRHAAFALRDVAPLGWNIALGNASEEEELNRPGSLAYREFLEESLVLDGPPENASTQVRPFALPAGPLSDDWAWALTREHRLLRQAQDGLGFGDEGPGEPSALNPPRLRLSCESSASPDASKESDPSFAQPAPQLTAPEKANASTLQTNWRSGGSPVRLLEHATRMSLVVLDRQGRPHRTENVLVVLSLIECGIEVVKVIEWDLDPQDTMLDGELLHFADGSAEFIRRPISLIALDELEASFSEGLLHLPRRNHGTMPSFQAPEAFSASPPDFRWDAEARRLILEEGLRPGGGLASPRERERLNDAASDYREAARCITPSAAGALWAWFHLGREPSRS